MRRLTRQVWASSLLLLLCLPVAGVENANPDGREYPQDWNPRYIEETVLNSTLHMVTVGDGRKPALLLVHGLGQNGLMDWRPVIERLKDDYYIVALDLPGFGRSSLPQKHLSPANYAALLRWLVREEGLRDVHLVGHSMGGAVALFYAAYYPDSLSQLTLVDVAGILHRAAFVKSMASVDQSRYSFLPEALQRKAAQVLNFGESLVEKVNLLPDFTQWLRNNDMAWRALLSDQPNTNAALSLINTDYSYILEGVSTPATIIWGEQDPIAPVRTGEMLRWLLPRSELHVIPNARHVPLLTHSGQVTDLIRRGRRAGEETEQSPSQGGGTDLRCTGLTGARYSGAYRRVVLDGCLDAKLVNLRAESVEMRNSTVEASGLSVDAPSHGLRLDNSALQLTGSRVAGQVAMELDASRVDLAGVYLEGEQAAIRVNTRSVIVASVSEVQSPRYRGKLHGLVNAHDVVGEAMSELRSQAKPVPAREIQ